MTRVVSLDEHRAAQARAEDFAQHTAPDVRTLAVERAVAEIARETHGLDLDERIAVEVALWRLVNDAALRTRDPW